MQNNDFILFPSCGVKGQNPDRKKVKTDIQMVSSDLVMQCEVTNFKF